MHLIVNRERPFRQAEEEKMGCYLHVHGHSEGLYNRNRSVSTVIFRTADPFASMLSLMLLQMLSECLVQRWDYHVQTISRSQQRLKLYCI